MAKKRDHYETARMIINRLDEKGPATQKQLIDELDVPKNSTNRNIRGMLLKKLGIVVQLDNHKYGLKWHLPEEDKVKFNYHRANQRLRRNPTPEEMAGQIKESPDFTRDLLFKYIRFYREPDQHEISSSAAEVRDLVVWGGLHGEFKTMKAWFGKGISKVVIDGIDQSAFDQIMNGEPPISVEDAKRYLKEFPEMRPKIVETRDGAQLSYKIEWTDDFKNIMHSSYLWRNRSQVEVPRKLDLRLYRRYKEFLDKNGDYALDMIVKMAEKCAPSQEAINDLLGWMEFPENVVRSLEALKHFCENGLKVGNIDEKTQTKIANLLLDSFFGETSDEDMYQPAMEIIELLDLKDDEIAAKSREIILSSLKKGSDDSRMHKLGQWLARDPGMREELIEGLEDIMVGATDHRVNKLCKSFIKTIRPRKALQ